MNLDFMTKLGLLVLAALPFVEQPISADDRLPEYLQCEKFTLDKLQSMVYSTSVTPHWMPSGNTFWYSYKTSDGEHWYLVDPATRQKKELFDNVELAARLSEEMHDPYDAQHLPIQSLQAVDEKTFTFEVRSSQEKKSDDKKKKSKEKEIVYFRYDASSRTLTRLTEEEKPLKRLDWGTVSPDGKTVVYAKDLNLWKMSFEDYQKLRKDEKDSTITEIQITTDGVENFGYGMPRNVLNTDTICNGKRRGVYGLTFAPDSKHFAVLLSDSRMVKDIWVINSMAKPRPTLETYKYQMPGEKENPIEHLYIFDTETGNRKEVNTSAFKDQTLNIQTAEYNPGLMTRGYRQASIWTGDSKRFYISRTSRDLKRVDICSYTIGQDTLVPVIEERLNTYIDFINVLSPNEGKEIIHWSERDGWGHLYLYSEDGKLKNRITKGPWHVEQIVRLDNKNRVVYFTASGKNEGENPYYMHLYRCNLDGSGLKQLDEKNFFHEPVMTYNAGYFVDNFSRSDCAPVTELRDAQGNKIMTLEKADLSQLIAAGYKFPEIFKVKAGDGVTDLWGCMYKPFDFDSTKVYPIIDYVYPGPQVEATYYPWKNMNPRTDRLAQAGFIVISVGQRGGHPWRSKWYHNYGYGNMRDYPLADHKYAIEQLASRHSYIDVNRVGIHGHSGGGFMTFAAMCQYPDFFKVGVSCAGNHDNAIYNRWWSEKHHGVREDVTAQGDTTFIYSVANNQELASKLQGRLLIVHGDIDNNVHPANTVRVINNLIRAGKRFDMLFLPTQRHGFGDMNEYFYWRLVDHFSKYLKGESETSVDIPKRSNLNAR